MVEKVRNATVSVGTSSVLVSPELRAGERRVFVATNTSTGGQNITLSWGATAIAGAGIYLTPNSTWSESVDSAFVPHWATIEAIASAAGGTLAIHERVM